MFGDLYPVGHYNLFACIETSFCYVFSTFCCHGNFYLLGCLIAVSRHFAKWPLSVTACDVSVSCKSLMEICSQENQISLRACWMRLLEIYSPLNSVSSGTAVFEFFHKNCLTSHLGGGPLWRGVVFGDQKTFYAMSQVEIGDKNLLNINIPKCLIFAFYGSLGGAWLRPGWYSSLAYTVYGTKKNVCLGAVSR